MAEVIMKNSNSNSNNNRRFILLGFLLLGSTIVITTAQECTLNCPVDAPCTIGAGAFDDDHDAISDGLGNGTNGIQQHCACPSGWTGLLCDRKYETCTEDHNCYHGGKCLPGFSDNYGNDQMFCDCTSAINTQDGTRYVGKYCETPFDQICDSTGQTFCVNGGECNPNYHEFDGDQAHPCICPQGWEGFHCEFKTGTVPDCTLDCTHNGICVVGVQNPAEAEHFHHAWSSVTDLEEHMRCLCPPGYGGPLCESVAEKCGDDESLGVHHTGEPDGAHYCYHGGSCVTTTRTSQGITTTEYHCDCTTAGDEDGNLFAGQYCQFPSTDICSQTNDNLFCVNGGTCNSDEDDVGGVMQCDCPTGYSGFRCDVPIDDGGDFTDEDVGPILCGDVYCLNGARCIEEKIVSSDGTEVGRHEICDCTNVVDSSDDDLPFAGPACQYKATELCTDSIGTIDGGGIEFCVNGGSCPVTPDQTCDCKSGWSGDSCEHHTLADKDPDDSNPTCGEYVCLNGGQCVETQVVQDDGSTTMLQHCDCTQAFDEKHLYAGTSCQHPSTHICTHRANENESLEGHIFCTNHGTCHSNPIKGCDCPEGFSGFSCEFDKTDADDFVNSDSLDPGYDDLDSDRCGEDLICHNGGSCVSTVIQSDGDDPRTVYHCDCTSAVTDDTAFAGPQCEYEATSFCTLPHEGQGLESTLFCVNHGECRDNVLTGCDCPTGWSGVSCEFAQDADDLVGDNGDDSVGACGDSGDFFCFNGGTCVAHDDGTGHTCDCSTAFNENHIFAGPTCQFQSTSICAEVDDSETLQGKPFCVNHGSCAVSPEDTEDCTCPSGWSGKHCEIQAGSPADGNSDGGDGAPCGDGYCYNGGECVTTRIKRADGTVTEEDYCDCSNAFTPNDVYAGESCEHKSTTFCSQPSDGSPPLFCTNGGMCGDSPLEGCDCPPQWTGHACQFERDPEDIAESLDELDNLQECGDVGVCFNGGECVTTTIVEDGTTSEFKHCDCTEAYTDTHLFAGPQCEFKSTDHCTEPPAGEDLRGSIFCVNQGTCKDNVMEGCDCPPAWSGLRCEFPADEDDVFGSSSDDTNYVDEYVPCGKDFCYFGGECTTAIINGEELPKCDCSAAMTDTDLYDGEFCQYRSTVFCSEPNGDDLRGVEFCTNGGSCPDDELSGCHCPSGYVGDRCEFPLFEGQDSEDNIAPGHDFSDSDDHEDCHLQCQNGGICAKGAKDLGDLDQTVEHVDHLNKTYSSKYFEHCVCQDGWTGIECEHKVEVCGDGEHVCLHGSTCVKDGDDEHTCDCSAADETPADSQEGHPLFAGDSCEHPATDICMISEEYIGRPLYFCVNQGSCRAYVAAEDGFPGCDCPKDWTGPHCELHVASLKEDAKKVAKTGARVFLGVLMAVVGLALVVVGSMYCIRRRNRNDESSNKNCMNFRRQRSDRRFVVDPNEQQSNLAPKGTSPHRLSSTDPMITAGLTLPPDDEPEPYYDEPPLENYRDEPVMVNIGPPRDDDGHILASVNLDDVSDANDFI